MIICDLVIFRFVLIALLLQISQVIQLVKNFYNKKFTI